MFDLALLGVFGGFFIVPLYALMQTRSNPAHRSRVIAGNNIMNALFMVIAALGAAAPKELAAARNRLPLFVPDIGLESTAPVAKCMVKSCLRRIEHAPAIGLTNRIGLRLDARAPGAGVVPPSRPGIEARSVLPQARRRVVAFERAVGDEMIQPRAGLLGAREHRVAVKTEDQPLREQRRGRQRPGRREDEAAAPSLVRAARAAHY